MKIKNTGGNILMDQNKILSLIASFGEKYENEYLSKECLKKNDIEVNKIRQDWWEALKFFYGRAFYQARRDEISERVEEKALDKLSNYFATPSKRDKNFRELMKANWKPLIKDLKSVIGKKKIGRRYDIEMVIDSLKFISKLQDKNIVKYSAELIEKGETEPLWNNLQKSCSSSGIKWVGPKIASFYLRDLVTLLGLQQKISDDDQVFVQPIDTWVNHIAEKIE